MGPRDLTKAPPRSARAERAGIAYLPRAIDEMRAEMGEGGTTMIGGFCRITGITHDELVRMVADAADDAEVAEWLHDRLDDAVIVKWNERYDGTTIAHIKSPVRERMFRAHPGAAALAETTPLADMLDADDAAAFGAT